MKSALQKAAAIGERAGAAKVDSPKVSTFREFLLKYARVKMADGSYAAYSFVGREALEFVVGVIDKVLTEKISDAKLTVTGSAQFGKTILELNLLAFLAGIYFRSVGLFLPDGDLVENMVQQKLRPDVLDQQPWLNAMIDIGKAVNASGKTVHRVGLFRVTDGKNRGANVMVHGMQKIPTTFSFDVVIEDEKDDIPPAMSKYLTARMTASDLRFRLSIGTQRYAGAGQNKDFEDGTIHIGYFTCAGCGHRQNPEENFPAICRLGIDGRPGVDDPVLTLEGNFKRNGGEVAATARQGSVSSDSASNMGETVYDFDPNGFFYLGCLRCGTLLDRRRPEFAATHPEREKQNHWSVRISQLLEDAISLKQITADWCNNAVKDPDAMKTFYVDRLGLPRSNAQGVDQKILDRARSVEAFDLSVKVTRPATVRYAGLDTGDRCWLTVREVESATVKRITWLEQLSAERVRQRVPDVFENMGIATLFVDAGPLRDLARDLCFLLNGLSGFNPPRIPDPERAQIFFPNGLAWDGRNQQWRGLKCAAVEFTLKEAKGIVHKLGITQDGLYYPVIACNRDETIERVVNELLTASENVIEVIDGKLRTVPKMRLPRKDAGSPRIIETFDAHIISGSRRERDDKGLAEHFVDGCENHFLLSDAYSALAESVGSTTKQFSSGFTSTKQFRTGKLAVAS